VVSRLLRSAVLATILALGAASAASAHATLEGTTPARGAVVAQQPGQVVFRFDEAVEGNFGAVRVFDAAGDRVDKGDAFHPGGTGSQLAVHLKPGLKDGTYTATYRVVSADGHIVSSGVVFSIGKASVAGATVEDLLGRSTTGKVTSTAFGVARGIQYAALALAGGALAFLLLVWRGAPAGVSEAFGRRLRLLVLGAAAAGTVSALAQVTLEAAQAAGVSGWSALHPDTLREILGTRFGTVWSIAAGCWVGTAALAAVLLGRVPALRAATARAEGGGGRGAATARAEGGDVRGGAARTAVLAGLGVLVAYLVAAPALSGHASSQNQLVLLPANILHVGAMTVWLGGLACLLAAVPAATRRLAPGERTRLLAGVLERFSAVALVSVIVLLVAGLVQAYVLIRHLDLIFTTAFGRAVFIKLVLLLGLIGLGALNRQRTVPRLRAAAAAGDTPGATGIVLRRTLRGEVALIAVVLGVTGALAGYPPATAVSSGPYSTRTAIGPQELQLTLDPARVGPNEIHLYLTDPKTGAQLDDAKEVDIAATLPAKGIGAMQSKATKAGPGHYVIPGFALGVAGEWQLRVTVRVSDFDEYEKKLTVRIR